MTVKRLVEILNDWDEDVEIYLSSDAEGNNFHKLQQVSIDGGELIDSDSDRGVLILWP